MRYMTRNMSVGIRASANKFAFLHVQDSSDESDSAEQAPKVQGNAKGPKKANPPNSSANAKKKARRRRKKNSSTSSDTTPGGTHEAENQMQDWVQHDQKLVGSVYDDDLKKAIELSKVEFEKSQTERNYYVPSISVNIPRRTTHGQGNVDEELLESKGGSPQIKERKKNKLIKTTSLEQFHQHIENSLPLQEDEPQMPESSSQSRVATEDTSHFFDEVEKVATYIKRNDQPIQRLNAVDVKEAKLKSEKTNKRDRRQQAEEEKDQVIEKLHTEISQWEQQFKHVKKRNKQLLVMLQQGEMKDKSELLLEIERLSILRDELTQEVSNLNENLEQERSRSSKLKDQVLKLQAKKSHEDN